jgi:tetratricopeptide (TPR) repeat protein
MMCLRHGLPGKTGFLAILLVFSCVPGFSGTQAAEKEKTLRRVYTRIIKAIGDARPAPALQFILDSAGTANRVAWFDPSRKTIAIEEHAFDICMSTGPDSLNALAFLLGHELAHYYKDHSWGGDFGSENADLTSGRAIERSAGSTDEILIMETQADEFGGFFGHLAGYQSLACAPTLLPSIYTGFHLPQRLNGYPSLPERVTIAKRSAERLESFIPIFDAAERLLVIGAYKQAGALFDVVARAFPSREVLANAGVARALEAAQLLDAKLWPWVLPFEIDGTTRLQTHASRGESEDERDARCTHLLEEATALLQQARDRDPDYVPVMTNLALVHLMGGDEAFAQAFAGKAVTMAKKGENIPDIIAALQTQALVTERTGNHSSALDIMREAVELGSSSASYNLTVLEGKSISRPRQPSRPRGDDVETVGGIAAHRASSNRYPDVDLCLPVADCKDPGYRDGSLRRTGRISLWRNPGWCFLAVQMGDTTLPMLRTLDGYSNSTTRNIAIRDGVDKVHTMYGQPDVTVLGREGEFEVYRTDRIVFLIDAARTVREWFIFDPGIEQ